MKKIYTLLFSTATLLSASFAQTAPDIPFQKGDKLLGGSFSITSTNSNGPNNSLTGIGISPSFGVFKKPNQLIGFSLQYSTTWPLNGRVRSYGLSLYKQYWNRLTKNMYFVLQGTVAVKYDRNSAYKNDSVGIIKDVNNFVNVNASVSPGFAYRINKHFIIDAFVANIVSLTYGYGNYKGFGVSDNLIVQNHWNNININTSLNGFSLSNVQLGFRYVL